MSQSLILSFLMNTAVVTPTVPAEKPAAAVEAAKTADCDQKDKKVGAALTEPKTDEAKAAEDKALANLGLKKEEPKKPVNPVVTTAPAMETCK